MMVGTLGTFFGYASIMMARGGLARVGFSLELLRYVDLGDQGRTRWSWKDMDWNSARVKDHPDMQFLGAKCTESDPHW